MSGHEFRFIKGWARFTSAAIAGSLVLATAQTAVAGHNDNLNFRDFRAQNTSIDRYTARKMFQDVHRQQRLQDSGRYDLHIQPMNTSGATTNASNSNVQLPQSHRIHSHEPRNRSIQLSDSGQIVRFKSGLDLDLGSNSRNITLGQNLFADGGSVEITEGGESKTLSAGSIVTAAEYVAVKQALNGGQTVTIDRNGRATGGNVDLESIASDRAALRASELVIPVNVTTSGDFSRNSDFRLLGNLDNYGTLHALSSDDSSRSGSIRAVDINNYKGATISSDISSLTLDASGDLNNYGTIQSTGALTLAAAGSVNNHGTTRATSDLSLVSSNINNSGLLQSTSGNVNVDGSASAVLNVDNSKGTLQALNGAINIRNASYNGTFDTYVQGGDLRSKDVNIYAGQANANLAVGDLTGVVNEYGLASHVTASTDSLNLGSICLTGDPTFYNTAGDINITSSINVSENLVLVASKNITSANGVSIQAGSAATGFEINLIAGAAFTPSGGANSPTLPPLTGAGGVSLSGKGSKTGGGVLLGTGVTVSTQAQPSAGNTDGQGVLMVAFGKKGTAGTIDVSGTTIKTGGSGTGKNGDVYLLAASTKGDVIKTGIIDTSGGSDVSTNGQQGVVGIYTVDIVTSDGLPVVYDAQGKVTSGNFLTGNNLNSKGNILVTDTAAPIDIKAYDLRIDGGTITQNAQTDAARSAELIANGAITNGANANYKAASNIFLIGTDIGTQANPITVDSPDVESFGTNLQFANGNYVRITGTGPVILSGNSKSTLLFDAPTRVVSALPFGAQLQGTDVIINTQSIGILRNVIGTNVTITTDTGNINSAQFLNTFSAKNLTLTSKTGNINFSLPATVQTLATKTDTGNINITSVSGNTLTVTMLEATAGSIDLKAQSSVTLPAVVKAGGGTLSVDLARGTLTGGGTIFGKYGVTLASDDANGTISLLKNTTIDTNSDIAGQGDITLSAGPTVVGPAPPPPSTIQLNDTGTGSITITGTGLTGKSPTNKINLTGTADILINNGTTSAKNISLGGNVIITAP